MTVLVLLGTGFGPLVAAAILAATHPVVRPVIAGAAERVSWALGWWETRDREELLDAFHVLRIALINEWEGPERLYDAAHHKHRVAAL